MKSLSNPIKYHKERHIKWFPETIKSNFDENTSRIITVVLLNRIHREITNKFYIPIYKQLAINLFPND